MKWNRPQVFIIAAFFALATAIVWQFYQVQNSTVKKQWQVQTAAQVSFVEALVEKQTQNLKHEILFYSQNPQATVTGGIAGFVYYQKNTNGAWAPRTQQFNESLGVKLSEFDAADFANVIPLSEVTDVGTHFFEVDIKKQTKAWAVSFYVDHDGQKEILTGFLAPTYFNSWFGTAAGSQEFFVVNSQGFALVHPNPSYLGSSLMHMPAVQAALKNKLAAGSLKVVVDEAGPSVAGVTFSFVIRVLLLTFGIGILLWSYLLHQEKLLSGAVTSSVLASEKRPEPAREFVRPPLPTASATLGDKPKNELMSSYSKVATSLAQPLIAPLTACLGFLQAAKKSSSQSEMSSQLSHIEREIRKSRELVENFARLANEQKMDLKKIEIAEVLGSVLLQFRGECESKGIKVKKQFSPDQYVLAHFQYLTEALHGIVKNAIESMQSSSEKILIISTSSANGFVQLTIEDSGEGISDKRLTKIFDPFYSTKEGEHIGIGLSLAMATVKKHGGKLFVESKEKRGTKVVIQLPVAHQMKIDKAPIVAPTVAAEALPIIQSSELSANFIELDEETDDFVVSVRKPKVRIEN